MASSFAASDATLLARKLVNDYATREALKIESAFPGVRVSFLLSPVQAITTGECTTLTDEQAKAVATLPEAHRATLRGAFIGEQMAACRAAVAEMESELKTRVQLYKAGAQLGDVARAMSQFSRCQGPGEMAEMLVALDKDSRESLSRVLRNCGAALYSAGKQS